MLLKPRKRMPLVPKINVGCPFCHEKVPQPRMVKGQELNGVPGGQCSCGAFFVLDEVGRFGGQALIDVTTLACDGDVRAALKLEEGVHYELRTAPLRARFPRRAASRRLAMADRVDHNVGRRRRGFDPVPKVWFVQLNKSE